jgi:hypothetical protein
MATKIVPVQPLSSNDISSLAQTFQVAFNYFCQHSSPFAQDYLRNLSTLVGLGFTAALVDGDCVSAYDSDLKVFIAHRNFKACPEIIANLSLAIANMVSWATKLFGVLDYPRYYEDFALSVKNTVGGQISNLYGNPKETERLLSIILPN